MGRRRLETGEVGVSGTGDTINAGGNKLVHNFDEIYETLGDQSLAQEIQDPVTGELWIRPYPASYYQRYDLEYYQQNTLSAGSLHDIDVTEAETTVTLQLPEIIDTYEGLPPETNTVKYARIGDRIEIIDSKNLFGKVVSVEISCSPGQEFENGFSSIVVNESYRRILLFVSQDSSGNPVWDFSIRSIDGIEATGIVDTSVTIQSGQTERIPIINTDSYDAIKLNVYAEEYNAAQQMAINYSQGEIMLLNNQTEAIFTRYGVNETSTFFNIEPIVQFDTIWFDVTAASPNQVTFTVSSVDAVKSRLSYRAIVSRRFRLDWDQGGTQQRLFDLNWNTAGSVTNTLDVDFNVRSFVDNDLEVLYDIDNIP